MPFKSKAQMRYMYAKHPEVAKKWQSESDVSKGYPKMPEKKKPLIDYLDKKGRK